MSDFVLLFPGQGSQEPGMVETVARLRPDLLELAAVVVGEDPFARVGEGTRFDQPAIYCAALAGLERAGRPTADLYAGHSMGEITALAAAGALSEEDGLRLVAERGRLMETTAARTGGAMLAIRAGREQAEPIADRHGLAVANDNSPAQAVLSGPLPGIEAAEAEAGEEGMRAKRLPITGAFHSPLMADAVEPFLSFLQDVELRAPRAPVFSCVTAAPFDDVRKRLAEALVKPVRWVEVLHALYAAGGRRFEETGPAKALAGLARRTLEGVEIVAADPAGATGG
jgi:malonyl CoA-acyl carrier protein transacylase